MGVPVNQEVVNDTAKLVMHRLIARALSRDPTLIERARLALAAMASRFPDRSFAGDWERILRLPPDDIRVLLTRRDQDMTRLRLSSPFMSVEGVNFTDTVLRLRIGRVARRIAARGARSSDERRRLAGSPA